MKEVSSKNIKVKIDKGTIVSLKIGKRECCFGSCPLFAVRLRNEAGEAFIVDAFDAVSVNETSDSIEFSGFKGDFGSLTVQAFIKELKDSISWKISVDSVPDGYAVEWVEFPKICMPRLVDNNIEGGTILFPYDEGILITNESVFAAGFHRIRIPHMR